MLVAIIFHHVQGVLYL